MNDPPAADVRGAYNEVSASLIAKESRPHLVLVAMSAGAASFLAAGLTDNVFLAAAGLMLEATAVNAGVVATLSLRQALIPADLRGRVSNVFRTVAWGAYPLGAVIGGFVASSFGLHAPFLVAGVAQAVLMLVVAGPLLRLVKAQPAVGS